MYEYSVFENIINMILIVLVFAQLIVGTLNLVSSLNRTVVHDFSIDYTNRFIKEVSFIINTIAFENPGYKFYIFTPALNTSKLDFEVFKDADHRFHKFYRSYDFITGEKFYIFHFTITSPFTTSLMFESYLKDFPVESINKDKLGYYFHRLEQEEL